MSSAPPPVAPLEDEIPDPLELDELLAGRRDDAPVEAP
jgi:hypothetical protein